MRAYVDKLEGGKAELRLGDDEQVGVVVPLAWLPAGTHEGEVLRLSFERDEAATQRDVAANDAKRQAALERSKNEPF